MQACLIKIPTNAPIFPLKPFSYFSSSSNRVLKNPFFTNDDIQNENVEVTNSSTLPTHLITFYRVNAISADTVIQRKNMHLHCTPRPPPPLRHSRGPIIHQRQQGWGKLAVVSLYTSNDYCLRKYKHVKL